MVAGYQRYQTASGAPSHEEQSPGHDLVADALGAEFELEAVTEVVAGGG